jgi:hypothetical protein
MDEQRGSQKQIAKRYEDRVDYRNTRTPWRRTRFWLSALAIFGGAAAIYYAQDRTPPEFFNTGPLSRPHSNLQEGCASCHVAEQVTDTGRVVQVVSDRFENGAPSFERIDQACQQCHQQHTFHAPTVAENRSCSACHKEHQGHGGLMSVANRDCAACHNDTAIMQASARTGMQLPATQFRLNPKVVSTTGASPTVLQLQRPPNGYTEAFASFSEGHPEFQLHRETVRELEVLRFNHQRHLAGPGIPLTKAGAKLDCNYCHKQEPSGRYMQRVSYEASCQECHSLQFDVRNPDFVLPHGDASLVRTFLRTLPAQYGEFARRQRRITDENRVRDFTAVQIRELLGQFGSAEELERAVFFTKDPYKATQQRESTSRAQYAGCAFCHEVGGPAFPAAEIVKPVIIDRWMPHAHFNHAKHANISCRDCHANAEGSQLTADVLMPRKESCATCHSPAGVAAKASDCMTCHVYHAPVPAAAAASARAVSFKQMALGTTR